MPPSENLTLSCQQARKHIATGHFHNWYEKVNSKRHGLDVLHHVQIVFIYDVDVFIFIFLLEYTGAAHLCDACFVISVTKDGCADVAASHLLDDFVEVVMFDGFDQASFVLRCFVVLEVGVDEVFGEADFAVRVGAPDVKRRRIGEGFGHRADH
jgi:hypothetical protein